MPDPLCRVSIHWVDDGADGAATVDLALPTALVLGQLMPSIIEALGAGDDMPRRWQLARIGGPSLDQCTTLAQNDIRDGDLLLLTASVLAAPRHWQKSPDTAPVLEGPDARAATALRAAAGLWLWLLGASALGWGGLDAGAGSRLAATAVAAVAAIVAALAAHRLRLAAPTVTTLNICAVLQAAVFGFLVVPGGPAAANFFLATVAAVSAGTVLLRLAGSDAPLATMWLAAVLSVAATVAIATAGAVLWPLTVPAVGAIVAAVALGALSLAPRLSIAVAGLTPAMPGADEEQGIDFAHADDIRMTRGHRTLTGLVIGCSAAAALGTLLVAMGGLHQVTFQAVAFTAAIGLALALRSRSYASGSCRIALQCTGFISLTATFTLALVWSPAHASWMGIAVLAIGLTAVAPTLAAGPLALRAVDAVEYVALVSVAPLACWLTGAFELVRGLSVL